MQSRSTPSILILLSLDLLWSVVGVDHGPTPESFEF